MGVSIAKEAAMANDPKPTDDTAPDGTDVLGPESGDTDVLGPESGDTDILGSEPG